MASGSPNGTTHGATNTLGSWCPTSLGLTVDHRLSTAAPKICHGGFHRRIRIHSLSRSRAVLLKSLRLLCDSLRVRCRGRLGSTCNITPAGRG